MDINQYNEKVFQAAFKEVESVLENNLDEEYDKIDVVLDRIPQGHHDIVIKPLVKSV